MSTIICQIMMIWNENKLSIRIEKASKPRLKVNGNLVHILVPWGTEESWPPVKVNLKGLDVVLTKMQTQHKITVQHTLEKKPDIVLFVSGSAHEKEIKTQVKEINTQIDQVGISGPNMDVVGVLRAQNLTLEATMGTMHLNCRSQTTRLALHGQFIVVATEAILQTHKLRTICRRIQIDGKVLSSNASDASGKTSSATACLLDVAIDAALLHIGVDGCIGDLGDKENKSKTIKINCSETSTDELSFRISGSLANHGRIASTSHLKLHIGESLLSLAKGNIDSASRGYSALKTLRKVGREVPSGVGDAPCTSRLHSAIEGDDVHGAAELIEKGVDLGDTFSRKETLRQTAMRRLREKHRESTANRIREKSSLINALFTIHHWRRGTIKSRCIEASIEKNGDDIAQFNAQQLVIKIGNNGTVEPDSIWTSEWAELTVGATLQFLGQTKLRSLVLNCGDEVFTGSDAIIATDTIANINCSRFSCHGIWTISGEMTVESSDVSYFSPQSHIQCEKLEVVSLTCETGGSWQLGSLWIFSQKDVSLLSSAKIFVETGASVTAQSVLMDGFCNVTDDITVHVRDLIHIGAQGKLETQILNILNEGNCTFDGIVIAEKANIYVRDCLKTNSCGKVAVFLDAEVTAGTFHVDSLWQVEKDLGIICGILSGEGTIFAKGKLRIVIHLNSHTKARIVASSIFLKCVHECVLEGFLKANEMEVELPYPTESRLTIKGQWDILTAPLVLKGYCTPNNERTQTNPFPSLVIDGALNAVAIVAPFLAVQLGKTSVVRLSGLLPAGAAIMEPSINFSLLLTAGSLTASKGSWIISIAKTTDLGMEHEGLIVAGTWIHEGQIRFSGRHVYLMVNNWTNRGRMTNVIDKHNHITFCSILVDENFVNESTLAADVLRIRGEGELDNRGRIFASDNMDIGLKNFCNDDGELESRRKMLLVSSGKEWTRLGGALRSIEPLQLRARKLHINVKDVSGLCSDSSLQFSAHSDLRISSKISDNKMSLGCAAKNSVIFDAPVEVSRLEVLLGEKNIRPVSMTINEDSHLVCDTMVVNGGAPVLNINVNGTFSCRRLRVSADFLKVFISGRGKVQVDILNCEASDIYLDLCQLFNVNDVMGKIICIHKDSYLRMEPTSQNESTSINCEALMVEGTLFVEKKVFVTRRNSEKSLKIHGTIIGSSPTSELSIEASSLTLKVHLANFRFCELFANYSINIQNSLFKNLRGFALEATDLSFSAQMSKCDHCAFSSNSANLSGVCKESGVFSVFSMNTTSTMGFEQMEKVSFGCNRNLQLCGTVQDVANLNLDAKWLTLACTVSNCASMTATAWSMILSRSIVADDVIMTSLGAVINRSIIRAHDIKMVAPFVLSIGNDSIIEADRISIEALVFCSDSPLPPTKSVIYLSLFFSESAGSPTILPQESNAWKQTTTMMTDRFRSGSMEVEEILLGMKYLSELEPVKVNCSRSSELYSNLSKTLDKFIKSPISVLNMADLAHILSRGRSEIPIGNSNSLQTEKKKRRKENGSALYEGLVQFKSSKYALEQKDARDLDIGYASRSDSEEMDKISASNSPEPPNHFSSNEFEKIENELENVISEITVEKFVEAVAGESELLEFEELEEEMEMAEKGQVRTDYIMCDKKKVRLARLCKKRLSMVPLRPKPQFPLVRAPSNRDLVFMKFKMKNAVSNLDLRSFGSESSLLSLDFSPEGDIGSPIQFTTSVFQRSKIPRGSFRSPRKAGNYGD